MFKSYIEWFHVRYELLSFWSKRYACEKAKPKILKIDEQSNMSTGAPCVCVQPLLKRTEQRVDGLRKDLHKQNQRQNLHFSALIWLEIEALARAKHVCSKRRERIFSTCVA